MADKNISSESPLSQLPTKEQIDLLLKKYQLVREESESTEDVLKKIAEVIAEQNIEEQAILKLIQKKLQFEKELEKISQKELKSLKEQVQETKGLLGLFKTKEEKILARLALLKKELEELKKQKEVNQKLIDDKEKEIELAEKHLAVEKKIRDVKAGMLKWFNVVKDMFERIVDLGNAFSGGMLKQLTSWFTFTGLLQNAEERLKMMRDSASKFAETTGRALDPKFWSNVDAGLAKYGLSQKRLVETNGQLFVSMSNFSNLNESMQNKLTVVATKMANFGISAQTAGKNFDTFTKAMRMSTDGAIAATEKLQKAAIGAGIAPKRMVEEFASAMPKLAVYGQKAIDVYINMQKQAKALGMEIQALTNIVGDQFDTFEGSATAAGKLNAILGGNYLNSVEMLNATEDERIMILKRSMDEAGKNFSVLSKYEQKAIASALGISNMEEANKLFGVSTSEVTKEIAKQEASNDALSNSQMAAAKMADIMEAKMDMLNATILNIGNTIQEYIDKAMKWIQENEGWVKVILGAVAAIGILMPLLKALAGPVSDAILRSFFNVKVSSGEAMTGVTKTMDKVGQSAASVETAGTKLNTASESMSKTGQIGNSAAGKLVGFAIVILAIGFAVKIATEGIAKMVKAFKGLTGEEMVGAIFATISVLAGFAFMISILGGIGTVSAPGMLAIAAAIFAIGLSLGIVFNSLANFTKAMSGFMQSLESLSKVGSEKIDALSDSISSLASSLAGGAFSSAVGGIFGGKTVGQMIIDFTSALSRLKVDQMKEFNELMKNLVGILKSDNIAAGMKSVSDGIEAMAEALNEMPDKKIISLETLNQSLEIVKTLNEANVKPTLDVVREIKAVQPTQEFVQVMQHFHEIQLQQKENKENFLLEGIREIGGLIKESFSTSSQAKPINLVVQGRDLSSALNDFGQSIVSGKLTA